MTDYEDVKYQVDTGVAVITINRPEAYNAFTEETILELNDALRRAAHDSGVVATVLTGADDKFCAGADLDGMTDWEDRSYDEYGAFLWTVQNVVRQLRTMPKPTIGAVSGAAVGAGCDFALACDMRVLAPDATLREGFVRVGLVPGDGGGWLLPRLIGRGRALEYLLTGANISAEEADELGLANRISETPINTATDLASTFRNIPRQAVRLTKQLVQTDSFEQYCEMAAEYQYECIQDPEHTEAVQAMADGTQPEFDRDYTTTT